MSSNRLHTMQQQARRALLAKIYEPAAKLQKGSPECEKLASSGKIWEDYFQPGNSLLKGYVSLQREHRSLLTKIYELKARLSTLVLSRSLVAEYAQQSVMIEDNPLQVSDSLRIFGKLKRKQFLRQGGMASMPSSKLAELSIPQTEERESSQTNELKNHVVASQWIADNAAIRLGTAGVSEAEARDLAVVAVKGTASQAAYLEAWGKRVPLGGYRTLPIQVRSNHLVVFPYPQEIPACVHRFFEWRDSQHKAKELHPLILACQMTAYFVHINPFPDGNGRTSRMMMQDYMVRQGYLPAVLQHLERQDYLRMISNACDGKPEEFVTAVLEA